MATTLHDPRRYVVLSALSIAFLAGLQSAGAVEPVPDTPFLQEYREPFPGADEAPKHVRAIAVAGDGQVWIAGEFGVRQWDGAEWKSPPGPAIDGPAFDLLTDDSGDVLVAAWNGLYAIRDGRLETIDDIKQTVAGLAGSGDKVFAAGPFGAWLRTGGKWQPIKGEWATEINDLLIDGDNLWIATNRGLYRHANGQTTRLHKADELLSCDVRALALDTDGKLWAGSSGGIDVLVDGQSQQKFTGAEGLPSTDVRSLRFDDQGRLWVGTGIGLARRDGDRWVLRHSLRWLPGDGVYDVALDDAGNAWVATSGGVSVLKAKPMTLADKAAHYDELLHARHVRPPGLIEQCILKKPGDLSTFAPTDTDNDGSFTGYYCAAATYQYAVTKDPKAKENAIAAYRAMEFLQDVTGTESFVARTVIPSEWTSMADINRSHTPQELAEMAVEDPRHKYVPKRWRKSADGKWLWKGDTSSDEISGHYYVWGVYYDLIDDPAEQERVRQLVRRVTDGLIEGGYVLRDLDGNATRWGVWSPELLNGDPNWAPEKGVNSVEMLSYLNVAHHITGDDKYQQAAQELFEKHRYGENVLVPRPSSPGDYTFIDDDLLTFSYPGLISYEQDPTRRDRYLQSIDNWHGTIPGVYSPFYDFVYGSLSGNEIEAEKCVAFLRDVSLDQIRWSVDNSRREDVKLVRVPVVEDIQTDRLLPPSERHVDKWDSNPFQARGGNGGHTEHSPAFWLLPYWMGRHHGYIGPPEK